MHESVRGDSSESRQWGRAKREITVNRTLVWLGFLMILGIALSASGVMAHVYPVAKVLLMLVGFVMIVAAIWLIFFHYLLKQRSKIAAGELDVIHGSLSVFQEGLVTGDDRGVAWVEDNALKFRGLRTEVVLPAHLFDFEVNSTTVSAIYHQDDELKIVFHVEKPLARRENPFFTIKGSSQSSSQTLRLPPRSVQRKMTRTYFQSEILGLFLGSFCLITYAFEPVKSGRQIFLFAIYGIILVISVIGFVVKLKSWKTLQNLRRKYGDDRVSVAVQ